jgi:hypothetical protein
MMKKEGLIDLFKGKKIIPTSSGKILHQQMRQKILGIFGHFGGPK